jgi:predicted ATPase
MYTHLTLRNLRGIQDLRISDLRTINLIAGRNNSGKTTLLEGVFLLGGATNPVAPVTLGQLRGQRHGTASPDAIWRPLFYHLDPRLRIGIDGRWHDDQGLRRLEIEALEVSSCADLPDSGMGTGDGSASVTEDFVIGGLRLRYQPASGPEITTTALFDPKSGNVEAPSKERKDFVRTTFLSARAYSSLIRDAQQFSSLLKLKQERDVLDAVRIIEPSVERIEVLSDPGGPAVYVDLGLESLVPLAVCGEGFVHVFSLAVELTASRSGVLLIDEIDNGLHYSVMPTLWQLLGELCAKHRVQLFATTHNEEMIHAAFRAFAKDRSELGLYRLDRRGQAHVAVRYDEEDMEAILRESFEVRG